MFLQLRARFSPGGPRAETVHHLLEGSARDRAFGDLLPLQGPGHERSLLCEEESGKIFIRTDRLGFNNADETLYENFDAVVTGDSFVHGWCVPAEEHFIGALGLRALNLGITGSGALSQLGALIESGVFVREGRGRAIVWTVLLNDVLLDLDRELAETRLRAYFTGKSQGLAAHAAELSVGWGKWRASRRLSPEASLLLPDFLLAAYLRAFRGLPTRTDDQEYELKEALLATYAKIFARARSESLKRGYRFIPVFIPESGVFFDPARAEQARRVLGVLGKDAIDMKSVIDAQGGKPQEFYAAMPGYYGHFNKAGFALLATAIRTRLESTTNGRIVHFQKEER